MSWYQWLILGLLAAVWAWVLIRPVLLNMFNSARRDPVGHFNREMSVLAEAPQRSLAQTGGGAPGRPTGAFGFNPSGLSAAQHRRIQIFLALVISTVVSLVLAVAVGGIWVWELVLMAVLLGGYTLLAASVGGNQIERQNKVSYIAPSASNEFGSVYARAANDR